MTPRERAPDPSRLAGTAATQLHLILDAPSIIIFSLDREFCYTSFNRNHAAEMKRIWGVEIRTGMNMLELIPDEGDRTKARENFERALAGEEFTLVEAFGDDALSRRYYEDRYCPTRDAQGRILGVTVFVTNITERMRESEERLRNQERLQRAAKVQSLELMAAGIAHDFNNLLGAILGFAEVAAERVPPHDPTAECLELIADSAQRAAGLTRQLLEFAGRGQGNIEECRLAETIEGMEELLRATVPKQARLLLDIDEAGGILRADPAQLQQVVMNLVLNASQALKEGGGTIVVASRDARIDRDRCERFPLIYAVEPGPFTLLEVRDDGVGIRPEERPRVLEPFYSTRPDGRGLGLAAVQGIVRSLGGFLEIESEPGQGTTVRVGLPVSESCAVPSSAEGSCSISEVRPRSALSKSPLTILVSDDEVSVRTLMSRFLSARGHRVVLAVDGAEALEIFRADPSRFDLLVLDLTTPRTSGIEALRRVREQAADVPVLLMSGYCATDVTVDLERDPCSGFLQKPFRLAELDAAIDDVLARTLARNP